MSVDRLSSGYEPNFDIDAAVGRQGELLCSDIAAGIRDGSVEVKTDERALATGRVYVEYECFRLGEWRPSGIQTTSAEFWAIALGSPASVLVALPVDNMRRVARAAYAAGYRAETKRGTHPTKGALVPLNTLLLWALDVAA